MEKVFVFGTGNFYKEKENELHTKFEVLGYIDNKAVRGEKSFYGNTGKAFYHPEDFPRSSGFRIILMAKKFVELFYQLMKIGVEENKILFGILLFPTLERECVLAEAGKLEGIGNKLVYASKKHGKLFIWTQEEMDELANKLLREQYYLENPIIGFIADMPVQPISRDFGMMRGKAIDRYYIENFLNLHKEYIRGDVLEIADNHYTLEFGGKNVTNSYILHVMGWGQNAIKGDLTTGEGLTEDSFDALIITQTLMFIYDLGNVAMNIYRIMKKNAIALITVSGISQISRYDANLWGSYWGFHQDALKQLFYPLFGEENVEINSYGNVKTATAMLYGMCCEELKEEDFQVNDMDYPVITTVRLRKE